MAAAEELRVVTLNCWGLAVVSKDRQERMQSIAQELAKGDYDIVALQEVWVATDYQLIKDTTKNVLPYSHYFHGGMVGGGVCIFSKGPIVDTFYHPFRLNGYCQNIHQGDWFAGKMIGMCAIKLNGITIKVYTTHLHALYSQSLDPPSDEMLPHRLVQAYELGQFVHHTSAGSDLALVMGDLNTEPETLALKVIKSNGGLTDAWDVRENKEEKQPYTTVETASNCYTFQKSRYYHDNCPDGGRIDYVLFHANSNTVKVACTASARAFGKIPGKADMNYSDHEGVSSTFAITNIDSGSATCTTDLPDPKHLKTLRELLPAIQTAKQVATSNQVWFIVKTVIVLALMILSWMNDEDTWYLSTIMHLVNVGLVLMGAFFFCTAVVVKQTEKNVFAGVEKDVKLRIGLLEKRD